ncbi:alpha/beta fold hydrolase [Zhengella mangrovi]|nr:alpha/beta hydrolase [Zhengella mangrovi]
MLETPPALFLSRHPGPATVLLHGMVMAPCFWETYAPPVCRRGTAVAYPLPGHHPWSLDEAAATLTIDAVLEAYATAIRRDFRGRPVTLIGHSTGAFMALGLAARYPDLVEGLVLMGALSCGGLDGCQPFAMRLLRLPRFGQWTFERLLSHWISTPARFIDGARSCVADPDSPLRQDRDRQAIESVRLALLKSRPAEIATLVRLLSITSLSEELSGITCPALNIVGGRDRVIRPRHQFNIQASMPGMATLLLPEAGHLPMVENPPAVAEAVRSFMNLRFLHRLPASNRAARPASSGPVTANANEKPRDVSAPGFDGFAASAG